MSELCIDIVNALGFVIKHPSIVKNIKILNRQQINDYEELVSFEQRDITIYVFSLIFRVNDKKSIDIHGTYTWTLIDVPKNKDDLKKLFNTLYEIKNSVKNIKGIEDSQLIDIYYKYEKYFFE